MAQALHATITSTFGSSMAAGAKALKPLSDQLTIFSQLPRDERENFYLRLPLGTQNNRACQAVLRAAYQTVAECGGGENVDLKGITKRFVKNALVEWSDMQCLSILEVKGLDPYFGGERERAREFVKSTKEQLRKRLDNTVEQIVNSLEDPQVSKVKMPRKVKRLEKDVLQDIVPTMIDMP